ncbi:MAG: dihydropteroate synthase [Acidiferrobacteraceae bacterium]|nr:dihydropteroate synthase [Acidiferrobacteraceae bacterium]
MGILNVTPDSFFDGGHYVSVTNAVRRGEELVADGADIVDIGGESTRPGSAPVKSAEEIRRVVPVIEQLAKLIDVPISIDTSKPQVMKAAVEAGAGMINDVRALQVDGAPEIALSLGVPICLMHMRGEPMTMQDSPYYQDVVNEVRDFFDERLKACQAIGISSDKLLIDPGFGFGKSMDHNRRLLLGLDAFAELDLPMVVGFSQKLFIGSLLGDFDRDRTIGSAGTALYAVQKGAKIVRTHDVSQTKDLIQCWHSLSDS